MVYSKQTLEFAEYHVHVHKNDQLTLEQKNQIQLIAILLDEYEALKANTI